MTRLLAITVARKPLSEGSLARNVARWGVGAINVDGCRVGVAFVSSGGNNFDAWRTGEGREDRPEVHGHPSAKMVRGRWPANLVLNHQKGCRLVGTREVTRRMIDAAGTFHRVPESERRYGTMRGSKAIGSVTETVEAWECVEGCPVADLDGQSGDRRSAYPGNPLRADAFSGAFPSGEGWGMPHSGQQYSDTGGASRFFKQVGGETDADD